MCGGEEFTFMVSFFLWWDVLWCVELLVLSCGGEETSFYIHFETCTTARV